MANLAFIILGAILVTYGWYWGGVTEARTSAYAMGFGSFILGFLAAFNLSDNPAAWSLAALGAVFGILATANAWNESDQDRTYGWFALFFALTAIFGFMAENEALGENTEIGAGALVLAGMLVLHFIAAALIPANRGFKAFVGWLTLVAGVVLAYFGFAAQLGSGFTF